MMVTNTIFYIKSQGKGSGKDLISMAGECREYFIRAISEDMERRVDIVVN
jgi:hypothetical protein